MKKISHIVALAAALFSTLSFAEDPAKAEKLLKMINEFDTPKGAEPERLHKTCASTEKITCAVESTKSCGTEQVKISDGVTYATSRSGNPVLVASPEAYVRGVTACEPGNLYVSHLGILTCTDVNFGSGRTYKMYPKHRVSRRPQTPYSPQTVYVPAPPAGCYRH